MKHANAKMTIWKWAQNAKSDVDTPHRNKTKEKIK